MYKNILAIGAHADDVDVKRIGDDRGTRGDDHAGDVHDDNDTEDGDDVQDYGDV